MRSFLPEDFEELLLGKLLLGESLDLEDEIRLAGRIDRDPEFAERAVALSRVEVLFSTLSSSREVELEKNVMSAAYRKYGAVRAVGNSGGSNFVLKRISVRWATASLIVIVAVVMSLVVSRFPGRSADQISVVSLNGKAMARRNDRDVPIRAGTLLCSGDVLRTEASGAITLNWAGEHGSSMIDLGQNSVATLTNTDQGKHVDLMRGEFSADVSPQPSGKPMVLHTPHGRAEVLGTRFILNVGADATQLRVDHGRVLVTKDNVGQIVESQQVGTLPVSGAVDVSFRRASESLKDGLIAHWPLDECNGSQTMDLGGSYPLKMTRTDLKPGLTGKSMAFRDPCSALATGIVNLPDEFTLSLWVFAYEWDNGLRFLFSNSEVGLATPGLRLFVNVIETLPNGAVLLHNDGAIYLEAGNGMHWSRVSTRPAVMKLDAWQHISVSISRPSGRALIFVDGENVSRSSAIISDFPLRAPLSFGAAFGDYPLSISGRLDDIRIYDRVLRPDEIRGLFEAGHGN